MRLTEFERQTLKETAKACFGDATVVRLFGSRADDSKRGGDIDLLIETQAIDPAHVAAAHMRFVAAICTALGEQKLDVLIDYPMRQSRAPIYAVARNEGVVL